MAKCWRCGGGKTISMTTTGTHVLPCPTCDGSGESPLARKDDRKTVADVRHSEAGSLATSALDPLQIGPKVA